MSLFAFDDGKSLGGVTSVDTGNVIVQIADSEQIRHLQINHLVVLRSGKAGQHLIGIITKIMRKGLITPSTEGMDGEITEDSTIVENIIRVALIGTLLDRFGTKSNVFRRTLESVPEIDAPCFALDGDDLTSFMQAIASSLPEGRPSLWLGNYTLDDDAKAWLDGNRFFQRHAVIVGGTGTGKSWTVARVLEQVAELPMADAILLIFMGNTAPYKERDLFIFA